MAFHKILSALSAVLIAAIFLLIVADVGLRAVFNAPLDFASSSVEYMQLYFTVLAAPVLARVDGHVSLDIAQRYLPERFGLWLKQLALILSCLVCVAFAAASTALLFEAIASGAHDIRGITVPKWIIYAPLVACFSLLSIEYLLKSMRPTLSNPEIV